MWRDGSFWCQILPTGFWCIHVYMLEGFEIKSFPLNFDDGTSITIYQWRRCWITRSWYEKLEIYCWRECSCNNVGVRNDEIGINADVDNVTAVSGALCEAGGGWTAKPSWWGGKGSTKFGCFFLVVDMD